MRLFGSFVWAIGFSLVLVLLLAQLELPDFVIVIAFVGSLWYLLPRIHRAAGRISDH
jgi:hypothetical protein